MFKSKNIPKTEPVNPEIDHSRLTALLNSISDGVITINNSGVIVLTNGAVLNLLNQNSLTGLQLNEAIQLVDKVGQSVVFTNLIYSQPAGFNTKEYKLKFPDGSCINLFLSISPVTSGFGTNNGDGFVILLRDITREQMVEEERNEFVSVAGHELRTPVAIAEGSISNAILLAQKSGASEAILHTLHSAHNQVLFLSDMINDLAMLSRAERGNAALEITEFNVPELLKVVIDDYQSQAAAKGLALNIQIDQKLSSLRTSPLYLREILQNFITNSIKYTERGSITLSAASEKNGVRFSITDTGIGISVAEQKKLFSKFFRSDDSRVKKEHGTGLGLYVTGKLIKLLGGQLEMRSELDKGTTFQIYIPDQT